MFGTQARRESNRDSDCTTDDSGGNGKGSSGFFGRGHDVWFLDMLVEMLTEYKLGDLCTPYSERGIWNL